MAALRMLVLLSLFTVIFSACTKDSECNGLGTCVRGRCICFKGVLGENCEGANMCWAIGVGLSNVPVYCHLGGECVEGDLGKFSCDCRKGFEGPYCEAYSCSSDRSCNKRGQCILDDEHTFHGHCNCYPGFSGKDCYYDFCSYETVTIFNPDPCNSGGECVRFTRINQVQLGPVYMCECRAGFDGDACQNFACGTDTDCLNKGTCDNSGKSCECPHGSIIGKDCGDAKCGDWNDKESDLCSGNGNCIHSLTYACSCNNGFAGDDCSLTACSTDADCENGATCVNKSGNRYCDCVNGFKGAFCEKCRFPNNVYPLSPLDKNTPVCVSDDIVIHNYPCNGYGSVDPSSGECICRRDGEDLGKGYCVPRSEELMTCSIIRDSRGNVKQVCNDMGDCRYTALSEKWRCVCHRGAVRAKDGGCYPRECVKGGIMCSGSGKCEQDLSTGDYTCICNGNYVGQGGACVLKSGYVAVAVIIPLIIIGGVVGFLCWWFICHKNGGSGSKSSKGGSKRSKIRMSDGDSFSIQSGVSGFTSQL